MPFTSAHGPPPPGASIHQWAPAAGATAPPAIGDSHRPTLTLPQIIVEGVTGWRDAPETTSGNEEGRTADVGEVGYPVRYLGKTLVYECRIQADTRPNLLLAQNGLVIGFRNLSDLGVMTVTPWTEDGGASGGVVWTYGARVKALTFDSVWKLEGRSKIQYEWPFVLTLRMLDPLFYTGGTGYP